MNELLVTLVTIAIVMGCTLGGCLYLVLAERKVSAWMQDRVGPNRVGPYGLLQPIADAVKIVLKESVVPSYVDRYLYLVAPTIGVLTALLAFAVVPFGPVGEGPTWFRFIIAENVNIGIIFILAVTSLGVYGVILGGWASNNKYSALGSLRASAQVVSYEIPLGLSLLGVVLLSGTLNLEKLLEYQAVQGWRGWNLWFQPLACLIFFTSALAESNRLPFDLPECEQELVGGYHTEYGGLRLVMFFVGEYTHVVTISFLTAILFLGGWQFPVIAEVDSYYPGAWVVKLFVLLAKVGVLIFLIMLIRWTIPRFRFDQLMALAWVVLIPLALINLVAVMFVKQFDWSLWTLPFISLGIFVVSGILRVNAMRSELQHRPRATTIGA